MAVIGFVGLNRLAFTTKRRKHIKAPGPHGLPNPVRQKPSGLVADAERAVQLVGADTLLVEVIRWKAASHLCRAIWLRSMTVFMVTEKSLRHSFSAQRYTPARFVL